MGGRSSPCLPRSPSILQHRDVARQHQLPAASRPSFHTVPLPQQSYFSLPRGGWAPSGLPVHPGARAVLVVATSGGEVPALRPKRLPAERAGPW